MGHHHSAPIADPALRRRAGIALASFLIPLALATIAGLVWLWPQHSSDQVRLGQPYSSAPGVQILSATVARVDTSGDCSQRNESTGANKAQTCITPYVLLPHHEGQLAVQIPPEIRDQHPPEVGDQLRIIYFGATAEGVDEASATFIDYDRSLPVAFLAILYALVVILVARWRGLRAILGLGFAFVIMGLFMFPALVAGKPALWVALVGSVAIMFVVLYFAHGFTARTSTALLGTVFGLAVTAGLAIWVTDSAGLIGMGDESTYALNQQVPGISLSGLVVCGLMVAGLGVLNDVTITQASAVWELAQADPSMSARGLFSRAMRIGRDHIASTVYTIAFAYAGGAFATLLLLSLYDYTFSDFLTTGHLAEEVVRTLVGSIGLVLAIPVTTAIAVLVVKAVGTSSAPSSPAAPAGDSPVAFDADEPIPSLYDVVQGRDGGTRAPGADGTRGERVRRH